MYDALMLGRNKKVAAEEYQVATGRKEPASFRAEEPYIHISNVISDGEFSVHLVQDAPGYLEIEVFCADHFIIYDKKVISTDEFTDNTYEFKFMVISDRLHNGRNISAITFSTSGQILQIPVSIDNRIRVLVSDTNPRLRVLNLERSFLDMQTGKKESWEWCRYALELLDDLSGGDDDTLYLMLCKAQVALTSGDHVHARNYIEHVGTQIPKLENKNYDLYCYFIYLASLYEEVAGVRNLAVRGALEGSTTASAGGDGRLSLPPTENIMDMTALQKVRWVYSHDPSWNILWLLFYMDPEYQQDPERRLREMKEMFFQRDCISPIMYLESQKILQSMPELLTRIEPFEVHVLLFAVKYEQLGQEEARRLAALVLEQTAADMEPEDIRLCVRILGYAWKKYPEKEILHALCRMLIAAEDKDKAWHSCFRQALKEEILEDEIFDYYFHTLDTDSMDPLLPRALEYFLEHTELLYDHQPYVYANLIRNKFAVPEIYQKAMETITAYAEYQISQGQNGEWLAVIYKEFLDNGQLTQVMKNHLFDVLCTKEILCSNERMRSVLVFHKELQVYQESVLRRGRAFVKLYSSDALILFKDATGNIYHHIDYTINQLLDTREYIDLSLSDTSVSKYMLLGDTFPILRACKPALDILEFFTSHRMYGQFRQGYEQELLNKVVSYYAKNTRDDQVYDELLKFREFDLLPQTRGKLIEIMLQKGRVDDACQEILEYGPCGLNAEVFAELAHQYIELHGDDEVPLVTWLCEAGYGARGYDDHIFDYLYKHYDGNMDLLIDIYRSCNAYQKNAAIVEKRILHKAIDTGEHPEVVNQVFKRYYEEGTDKALITKYMEYRAGLYLYHIMKGTPRQEDISDTEFFDYMERDMMLGRPFEDYAVIAYLLYRTELAEPDEKQIRNIERHLKDLVRRGKMLEEFKYYRRFFELPSTLANNIIISAFSEDPENRPFIAYEITGSGNTVSGVEEMEEIFRRCYVKYFTLFYGEKVVFSMDGQENTEVKYSDLLISHDGSRYAELDEIMRLKDAGDPQQLQEAIRNFYIKEQMIGRLL